MHFGNVSHTFAVGAAGFYSVKAIHFGNGRLREPRKKGRERGVPFRDSEGLFHGIFVGIYGNVLQEFTLLA